jgi:hypothetical protein
MERQNKKIRDESAAYYDMSTEEREVLRIKDALDKRLAKAKHSTEEYKAACDEMAKSGIDVATRHGIVLIDKIILINFPLNDKRTLPTVRRSYLKQEELIRLDSEVTREEEAEVNLSSPARESVVTSESKSRLVEMSKEEYQLMKQTNWDYLRMVFPEMNDPEVQ